MLVFVDGRGKDLLILASCRILDTKRMGIIIFIAVHRPKTIHQRLERLGQIFISGRAIGPERVAVGRGTLIARSIDALG